MKRIVPAKILSPPMISPLPSIPLPTWKTFWADVMVANGEDVKHGAIIDLCGNSHKIIRPCPEGLCDGQCGERVEDHAAKGQLVNNDIARRYALGETIDSYAALTVRSRERKRALPGDNCDVVRSADLHNTVNMHWVSRLRTVGRRERDDAEPEYMGDIYMAEPWFFHNAQRDDSKWAVREAKPQQWEPRALVFDLPSLDSDEFDDFDDFDDFDNDPMDGDLLDDLSAGLTSLKISSFVPYDTPSTDICVVPPVGGSVAHVVPPDEGGVDCHVVPFADSGADGDASPATLIIEISDDEDDYEDYEDDGDDEAAGNANPSVALLDAAAEFLCDLWHSLGSH